MRNPIIFSKEAISLFSQIISKKKKRKKKESTIQTKYRSLEEILYFQSRFQSIHVRRFVYREMKSFIKLISRKERFIDNKKKKN